MTPSPVAPAFRIEGWHVLVAMLVFFGLIVAVDGAFMVAAYRSDPGQVSATPYEDGLRFDRRLAERKAQAALGWRAAVGAEPGRVAVRIRDRQDRPVEGLALSGDLNRPATARGGLALRFRETEPGLYLAPAGPMSGAWDLRVSARGQGGRAFQAERRLTWP